MSFTLGVPSAGSGNTVNTANEPVCRAVCERRRAVCAEVDATPRPFLSFWCFCGWHLTCSSSLFRGRGRGTGVGGYHRRKHRRCAGNPTARIGNIGTRSSGWFGPCIVQRELAHQLEEHDRLNRAAKNCAIVTPGGSRCWTPILREL